MEGFSFPKIKRKKKIIRFVETKNVLVSNTTKSTESREKHRERKVSYFNAKLQTFILFMFFTLLSSYFIHIAQLRFANKPTTK